MSISLLGFPPSLVNTISNRRLFHFFLCGAGGGGAGNASGNSGGGNGRFIAFTGYLEKEDTIYAYRGSGGQSTGGTSNAVGAGGGAASMIWVDPRKTRLGPDPNGFGATSNVLLAVAAGGGGAGNSNPGYGSNGGPVNTTTGAPLQNASGSGDNPGGGGGPTGPGLGGTLNIGGYDFNGSAGNSKSLLDTSSNGAGNGGDGLVNGSAGNYAVSTGLNKETVTGSGSLGVGGRGYTQGGSGGGGGFYAGGGSTFDGVGAKSCGAGGGSSFVNRTYCGAFNFYSQSGSSVDATNVLGFNLVTLASMPTTVGNGGVSGGTSVAGSNGTRGELVVIDENGDVVLNTCGASDTSTFFYTVV
jgi:hypothetical protein